MYEDVVEQTQRWLDKRADRFHWYYNASRIALIVLSVMIPTASGRRERTCHDRTGD